jgi:hypothetical protein
MRTVLVGLGGDGAVTVTDLAAYGDPGPAAAWVRPAHLATALCEGDIDVALEFVAAAAAAAAGQNGKGDRINIDNGNNENGARTTGSGLGRGPRGRRRAARGLYARSQRGHGNNIDKNNIAAAGPDSLRSRRSHGRRAVAPAPGWRDRTRHRGGSGGDGDDPIIGAGAAPSKKPTFNGVPPGTLGDDYVLVWSGVYRMVITDTASGKELYTDERVVIRAGTATTVGVSTCGQGGDATAAAVPSTVLGADATFTPEVAPPSFRITHASPGLGAIDVIDLASQITVSAGLYYGQTGDFLSPASGAMWNGDLASVTLGIVPSGGGVKDILAKVQPFAAATAAARGDLGDDDAGNATVAVTGVPHGGNLTAVSLRATVPGLDFGYAAVRAAHLASTESASVFAYAVSLAGHGTFRLGGGGPGGAIVYPGASDYVALLGGDYDIAFTSVESGQVAGGRGRVAAPLEIHVIARGKVTLSPGAVYTTALEGLGADVSAVNVDNGGTAPGAEVPQIQNQYAVGGRRLLQFHSPSPIVSPSVTPSPSPSPSPSASPSASMSPSPTVSPSPTTSPNSSVSPVPSVTVPPSPTVTPSPGPPPKFPILVRSLPTDATVQTPATVRIVNAAAGIGAGVGAAPLAVHLGGVSVTAGGGGIAYGSQSPYVSFAPGTYTAAVTTPEGAAGAIAGGGRGGSGFGSSNTTSVSRGVVIFTATQPATLIAGAAYSLLLSGTVGLPGFSVTLLQDFLDPPPLREVSIRAIVATSAVGSVNVAYSRMDDGLRVNFKIFEDIAPGSEDRSGYINLPAGLCTFEVTPTSSHNASDGP